MYKKHQYNNNIYGSEVLTTMKDNKISTLTFV